MNQFERDIGGRPAVLEYLDGEYRVITPGAFVHLRRDGHEDSA